MITRPDITAGLPERGPTWPLASGEIIHVLKEALVELALGRRTLRTRVFVVEIAGVLILGLDDASSRRVGGSEAPCSTVG